MYIILGTKNYKEHELVQWRLDNEDIQRPFVWAIKTGGNGSLDRKDNRLSSWAVKTTKIIYLGSEEYENFTWVWKITKNILGFWVITENI